MAEKNETVFFPLGSAVQKFGEADDPRVAAIGILRREEGGLQHKAHPMNPNTEYAV